MSPLTFQRPLDWLRNGEANLNVCYQCSSRPISIITWYCHGLISPRLSCDSKALHGHRALPRRKTPTTTYDAAHLSAQHHQEGGKPVSSCCIPTVALTTTGAPFTTTKSPATDNFTRGSNPTTTTPKALSRRSTHFRQATVPLAAASVVRPNTWESLPSAQHLYPANVTQSTRHLTGALPQSG